MRSFTVQLARAPLPLQSNLVEHVSCKNTLQIMTPGLHQYA
jgi:hypothetical protein